MSKSHTTGYSTVQKYGTVQYGGRTHEEVGSRGTAKNLVGTECLGRKNPPSQLAQQLLRAQPCLMPWASIHLHHQQQGADGQLAEVQTAGRGTDSWAESANGTEMLRGYTQCWHTTGISGCPACPPTSAQSKKLSSADEERTACMLTTRTGDV